MTEVLEKWFKLRENGTTTRREIASGMTTFMAMSYIIFVQPTVLSACGMNFGAVMIATCISSAIATILMAFLANYPIALAPAMGHNFYFAFTVCGAVAAKGLGYPWEVALGAVFISGALFILLSFVGFRVKIIDAVPSSLKSAIAVGIGLLIALIGLQWSGVVVDNPGTLIGLGDLSSGPVVLSITGLTIIALLLALRVPGAILLGIIATALIGLPFGIVKYFGVVSKPPSVLPTFMKLDVLAVFRQADFLSVIFVFFFLDLFDTIGTLIGVSEQAGFLKKGKLPRAKNALLSDAVGTVSGAALGTSTVTSYIESAAGVSVGGRTGFSNLITAFLLLISVFFYPLVRMVGGGYQTPQGAVLYPVIAPALIIVGSYMMRVVKKIEWEDVTEAIPAFLTMIVMPLTFSITEGIAFGFISYAFVKLVSGRGKEVHWIIYLFAVLFIMRYVYL